MIYLDTTSFVLLLANGIEAGSNDSGNLIIGSYEYERPSEPMKQRSYWSSLVPEPESALGSFLLFLMSASSGCISQGANSNSGEVPVAIRSRYTRNRGMGV